MAIEEKVYRTEWELSETVELAIRMLTLQLLSHLHDVVGSTSLYSVDDDDLLE